MIAVCAAGDLVDSQTSTKFRLERVNRIGGVYGALGLRLAGLLIGELLRVEVGVALDVAQITVPTDHREPQRIETAIGKP